jgi:hemolysin D
MSSFRRHWEVLVDSLRLDREQSKTAKKHEETEFLPAALEVLETPPNPLGRTVLWLLLAFVIISLLWAGFGRIDIVASAQGKIIPRGHVKIIQAADIGVVRAIHVTEGQPVRAGQPLVVLDATLTKADAAQARESQFVASVDRARAAALVEAASGGNGRFVAPDNTPPAINEVQGNLAAARIAEHRTELAALREERAQRAAELAMVGAEVGKLEEQLPLAEEQLSSLEKLDKDGLVPKLRVTEIKERVVGLRKDLVIRREEVFKSRAALSGVEHQIAKLQNEFRATALDAFTEADANYRLRTEEVKKADDKAALTVITSPISGTVAQLSVHTIGAVVKPADPLLIIVPQGAELIVEAMVLNKDVGFVHVGQPAEVKLEAYPFTRYGVLQGTIEQLSTDSVENKELGLVFPCLVRLRQAYIQIGDKRVSLAPGFSATAEIKTGDRRILEFLLSPLSRRLQEAGRER